MEKNAKDLKELWIGKDWYNEKDGIDLKKLSENLNTE